MKPTSTAKSCLQLRDTDRVVAALIVGPVAGLLALWLCFVVAEPRAIMRALLMLPWMFMVGAPVCAIVEVLFVLPLLIGFRRHGWRWLNSWSAACLGFALSALPWLGLLILAQTFAPYSTMPIKWGETIGTAALYGIVGLVAALVFRLMAVESVKPADV